MNKKTWLGIFVLSLVVGCSSKDDSTPAEKPTGVIPQAQLDALNKANQIEAAIQDAADKQREEIERMSNQ